MELVNETPYPARLVRTVIDRERVAAAVVARVTFDVAGDAPVVAKEQPWLVSPEPWDTPAGVPMEADVPFRKGGVDVHVFGTAHAPGGAPAGSWELRVEVGDHVRRALVFGPRTWTGRGDDLEASAPAPIASLPVTVENAFGGKAEFDGLEVAYPDNPSGKGFYLEREQALDGPLPQIEDPAAPVRAWTDRSVPVGFGFCPFPSGPRLQSAVVVEDDLIKEITHRLFNTAFPAMVAPKAAPGDRIVLTGFSPHGPIELVVPRAPLVARVEIGDRSIERPLAIDQIGIEVDAFRIFVALRFPFRYVLHPEELRRTTLLQKEG